MSTNVTEGFWCETLCLNARQLQTFGYIGTVVTVLCHLRVQTTYKSSYGAIAPRQELPQGQEADFYVAIDEARFFWRYYKSGRYSDFGATLSLIADLMW